KIKIEFTIKLINLLEKYNTTNIMIENGVGYFSGDIPFELQQLFTRNEDRYLVMPSKDMMIKFLGAK
ncbi:MAG: hypothetical protein HOJ35_01780, partial [Bdellovibrionales bacterium]|nr:hypothetical protein [Bdellovibrionales bacterium]